MRKLLALSLLLWPLAARSEESAQFLKIGVGARSAGLGGACTAAANDVTAMSWNPAGLSLLSKRELGAMHAELASDLRYDYAGYAAPLGLGTIGAGAAYLSQGSLVGRDETGRITGGFGASDAAASLSYGAPVNSRLRLGATARYIQSRIGALSAQTAAFDLGALYRLGNWGPGVPTLGFAAQNMGPGLNFGGSSAPLPLTLAAGLGYQLPAGWTLAADYKNRPNSGSSEISVGTEYAVVSNFALRAGYASNHGPISGLSRAGDLTGFAAGFGLRLGGYSLDYSMTPFGGLGNAQRFGLGARF
jgi:hypothetical protein